MQERVFMGIGNKPFMDIQPSDAAISDRAVNYALMGRGEQTLPAIQLQLLVTSFNSEAQLFDGVTLWLFPAYNPVSHKSNSHLVAAENKVLSSVVSRGTQDGLPGGRPKSVGSRSSSSSSSSSGRGSMSPVGYLCGPERRVVARDFGGHVSPPGALEEDDLDHESGSQNLLCKRSFHQFTIQYT